MRILDHRFRLLLLALALPATCLGAAHAQESRPDPDGAATVGRPAIQIESDKLEVREAEARPSSRANVSVVQGDTLLRSGRMTVSLRQSETGSAATGSAGIDRLEVDEKVYVKSAKPGRDGRPRHLRHEDRGARPVGPGGGAVGRPLTCSRAAS
jgi:hypothetical protein